MLRFSSPSALFSLAMAAILCWSATADARPGGPHGGQDCVERSDDERAAASLRKQIAATELVAALELSDEQKSQLAALVSEALAVREEGRERRATSAAEARPLLEDYLEGLQADGTPSDASTEALRAFAEERREGHPERKQKRQDMRERFRSILSDEQLQTLRSFRPMAAVRPGPEDTEEQAGAEARLRGRHDRRAGAGDPTRRGKQHSSNSDDRGRHARRKFLKVLVSEEMLGVLSR